MLVSIITDSILNIKVEGETGAMEAGKGKRKGKRTKIEAEAKGGYNKRGNGPEKPGGEERERTNETVAVRLGKRKRIKSNSEGENEERSTIKAHKERGFDRLTAGTDQYCGNSLSIVIGRDEITNIPHEQMHTPKSDHRTSTA